MNARLLLLIVPLAACSGPAPQPSDNGVSHTSAGATEPVAVTPAPSASAVADYAGRWRGVEGMFLNVTPRAGGGVTIEMQWDLDHRGTFPAEVTAQGLRFTRAGATELARPSDGAATGLKWLADKKDCLTVNPGEGYCRD